MKKKLLLRVCLVVLLIPLWIFLRNIYRDRIPAFGCFDDCNNYMGGYFLLSGKRLFSEIFFNHMPLMAYISELIQFWTKPQSIYSLVYEHRMMLIYYFIVADIFLVLRFGLVGFSFALLYEITKGYVFGERFLAEGMIIYPMVYLFILAWQKLHGKKTHPFELVIAGVFTWFIIFNREPYIPLSAVLYGFLLWTNRKQKSAIISVAIFGIVSFAVIFYHNPSDFLFNVLGANTDYITTETQAGNIAGLGLGRVLFYPVYLFFGGRWNVLRVVEVGLSVIFLLLCALRLKEKKGRALVIFLFIILALANIRPPFVTGQLYFEAFHHILWYGLFITSVLLLLSDVWKRQKTLASIATLGFIIITGYAGLAPQSYIRDRVDRQGEFTTNYATYYVTGEIVRRLSNPDDTLFLDGYDDLIYWQAKRFSSYPYSWYTTLMPGIAKFQKAREDMFGNQPPTFYYGRCPKEIFDPHSLPLGLASSYTRLSTSKSPTCLFVLQNKIPQISESQWEAVKEFDIVRP